MTYPQQPGYPAQPQFPQQQMPGYPPAPVAPAPQYPPQQPYAPAYQQMPPGYPQPQMAPPVQPLAQGSIADFYNQPSAGGGKSLSFGKVGTSYVGTITRAVGPGDIQQQTDTQGRPQTFRDGRPKFVMKVPLQLVQNTQDHPDGLATWYIKGQARDELVRAMAAAGAPEGPPEAGAMVQITYVSDRAAGPGMNPAKQFAIQYVRPNGAAPVPAPAPAVAQQPAPVQPAPVVQQMPVQQMPVQQFAPPMPVPAPPVQQQLPAQMVTPPPTPQPVAPVAQQMPQAPAAAPQQLAMPDGLDPAAQELFKRLTSQQQTPAA